VNIVESKVMMDAIALNICWCLLILILI